MPSFDVVSEIDQHELTNAVDNANRELTKRFDFRGVDASFELKDGAVKLSAEVDFQLDQLQEILHIQLIKRNIDIKCLEMKDPEKLGKLVLSWLTVREGLDPLLSKKMIRMIKDEKLKVQTAIQGDKLRVTGKKRDILQEVMTLLRGADLDMPLQFNNFRD